MESLLTQQPLPYTEACPSCWDWSPLQHPKGGGELCGGGNSALANLGRVCNFPLLCSRAISPPPRPPGVASGTGTRYLLFMSSRR